MKHLGDITKIDWSKVEPVDVVTGGSPCQGLSVAGLRKGLEDERSGLYMEQIRCVKELRDADKRRGRTGQFVRPRYMVWENVPGAFSSGTPKGADFGAVIEEIIKVAEPGTAVSVCVPDGGWTKSGCYYAEDGSWSIAWRVHDAQFWGATYYDDAGVPVKLGTPQRRKRIALIADFGGLSAPEILFERKGLSGDFEPCGEEGEGASGATGGGAEGAGEPAVAYGWPLGFRPENVRVYEEVGTTLCNGTRPGFTCGVIANQTVYENHSQDSRYKLLEDVCETVSAKYGTGGNNMPIVVGVDLYNQTTTGNVSKSLNSAATDADHVPCAMYTMQAIGEYKETGVGSSLKQRDYKDATDLVVAAVDCRNGVEHPTINGTLQAKSTGGTGLNFNNVCRTGRLVRRLTPLECERLQGYPDGWTLIGEPQEVEVKDYITEWVPGPDCKYATLKEAMIAWSDEIDDETIDPMDDEFSAFDYEGRGFVEKRVCIGSHKEVQYFYRDENGKRTRCTDSARYKALGNSIALPFWKWLAKRISAQYERDITMGSLFDGIGGFPLVFEQINGRGTARWASEVEEFCVAVTKKHFGED